MTQPLPVLLIMRQVPRQDAGFALFGGNMVAPVEVDRDFAAHQIKITRDNRAVPICGGVLALLRRYEIFWEPTRKSSKRGFQNKGAR